MTEENKRLLTEKLIRRHAKYISHRDIIDALDDEDLQNDPCITDDIFALIDSAWVNVSWPGAKNG